MLGTLVTTALVNTPPVSLILGPQKSAGLFPEICHHLQQMLNFSIALTKPEDDSYGSRSPNGSWNGMVEMLQSHRAHVAIVALTITQVCVCGHDVFHFLELGYLGWWKMSKDLISTFLPELPG